MEKKMPSPPPPPSPSPLLPPAPNPNPNPNPNPTHTQPPSRCVQILHIRARRCREASRLPQSNEGTPFVVRVASPDAPMDPALEKITLDYLVKVDQTGSRAERAARFLSKAKVVCWYVRNRHSRVREAALSDAPLHFARVHIAH